MLLSCRETLAVVQRAWAGSGFQGAPLPRMGLQLTAQGVYVGVVWVMKQQLDEDVRGMVGETSAEAATEAFVRCRTSLGVVIGSALWDRPRASLRGLPSSTGAVIARAPNFAVGARQLDIELQLKFNQRPWHSLVRRNPLPRFRD
jgi:hypothetical protein